MALSLSQIRGRLRLFDANQSCTTLTSIIFLGGTFHVKYSLRRTSVEIYCILQLYFQKNEIESKYTLCEIEIEKLL